MSGVNWKKSWLDGFFISLPLASVVVESLWFKLVQFRRQESRQDHLTFKWSFIGDEYAAIQRTRIYLQQFTTRTSANWIGKRFRVTRWKQKSIYQLICLNALTPTIIYFVLWLINVWAHNRRISLFQLILICRFNSGHYYLITFQSVFRDAATKSISQAQFRYFVQI